MYIYTLYRHCTYHSCTWCNAYNSAKYLRSQNYFPTRKKIACAIKIPPYSVTVFGRAWWNSSIALLASSRAQYILGKVSSKLLLAVLLK